MLVTRGKNNEKHDGAHISAGYRIKNVDPHVINSPSPSYLLSIPFLYPPILSPSTGCEAGGGRQPRRPLSRPLGSQRRREL